MILGWGLCPLEGGLSSVTQCKDHWHHCWWQGFTWRVRHITDHQGSIWPTGQCGWWQHWQWWWWHCYALRHSQHHSPLTVHTLLSTLTLAQLSGISSGHDLEDIKLVINTDLRIKFKVLGNCCKIKLLHIIFVLSTLKTCINIFCRQFFKCIPHSLLHCAYLFVPIHHV